MINKQTDPKSRPNFRRANQYADEVLRKFDYPPAPIDVQQITEELDIEVRYESLLGAAGYTYRLRDKDQWHYIMFIANDKSNRYSTKQLNNRQRFTIAHELGHILLHNHMDWTHLEGKKQEVLEVEANWFASRLLMPDYTFQSILDMLPAQLADKCRVNVQAATKRLKNLDPLHIQKIIGQAIDSTNTSPVSIKSLSYDFDWYTYYEEIAATVDS